MHSFRTHHCSGLSLDNVNQEVRISGWVHSKRDHGGVLFIDLRDAYGITQIVSSDSDDRIFKLDKASYDILSSLPLESVICVTGHVVNRTEDTVNDKLSTGYIEVVVERFEILSRASSPLPIMVAGDHPDPDDLRLKYRFIDLRKHRMHEKMLLRSNVIARIRQLLWSMGFHEFQTPILAASSPEGARDFLVPSRLHPGKFFALPQAPQQFKQLLMISGFDKYFQIAPCFRDEDSRADRSPGEFYQLDIEMSFVTQEDIFNTVEPVIRSIFEDFGSKKMDAEPFVRIKYSDAMLKYGCDKPDLRNPIELFDATEVFRGSDFSTFSRAIDKGCCVRAIPAPCAAGESRSFFDKMIAYAQSELGAKGLGYIIFQDGQAKGPVAKFLSEDRIMELKQRIPDGDAVFFSCDKLAMVEKISAGVRTKLGNDLALIDDNSYKFCWIVDYPFFAWDADLNKLDFSHNPFSMPRGGLKALNAATDKDLALSILADQYDIVCNGIELSSGAIRNHDLAVLYKAFEMVGYTKEEVDNEFCGMVKALKYGAPPHGGIAPGIDRIIMLLTGDENIREVIPFPLNQTGKDLLMNAPAYVDDIKLRDVGIQVLPKFKKEEEWNNSQ